MRTIVRSLLASACVFAVALLAACGNDSSSPLAGPAPYAAFGPYPVGVTTLDLGDRQVEVWYPAVRGSEKGIARDEYFIRDWLPPAIDALLPAEANPPFVTEAFRALPAADGRFPLVLFAHGFSGFRDQSTVLTTHLASWGFVVAAPDYLERGLAAALGQRPAVPRPDVEVSRATVDLLKAEDVRPGGPLAGHVSAERVAIFGHSAGGGSAVLFGKEPDVVTYVPMSAGTRDPLNLPDKPSLWLTGRTDGVAAVAGVEAAYGSAKSPKRLLIIDDAGHLAPSDLCAIGENGGGIVQIALEAGLPVPENLQRLGTDGCGPESLPVREGWPVIRHFVAAQMRWAFGIDAQPVGLSQGAGAAFPGVTIAYEEVP
ncbi:MAG: alpha/beta hydrolase family protein [Alphaproteobacteria bacterium]